MVSLQQEQKNYSYTSDREYRCGKFFLGSL